MKIAKIKANNEVCRATSANIIKRARVCHGDSACGWVVRCALLGAFSLGSIGCAEFYFQINYFLEN